MSLQFVRAQDGDLVSRARTSPVTFDDYDTGPNGIAAIDDGYARLDWTNVFAMDPVAALIDVHSGYHRGMTSGTQIAYTGYGRAASVELADGSFNLESVELTAAWDRKLKIEIIGYKDDVKVYDVFAKVTDKGPLHLELDFTGVDKVEFVPLKGTPDPKQVSEGDQLVFDDMVFSRIKGHALIGPSGHHDDASGLPASAGLGHAGLPHLDHHPTIALV